MFKQTGDVRERNRPGRKRKTDERLNRYLRRQSLSDRRRTAVDICRDINQWRGTRVSVWTVRRRLRKFGLKARLAYKKPLVSLKNRKKRLSFAKDHEHCSVEDWKKVLFTDETKVNLVGSNGKMYIRCFKNERFNPQFIKGYLQAGGGLILVWGSFRHDGTGLIVQIKNTFNSDKYISMLEETVKPFVKENMPRNFCFQQDNSLVHPAKKVKTWLKKNRFKTIDWPAQSPDLNPIENIWAIVKRRLAKKKCTNTNQLYENFAQEWNGLSQKICNNLIISMPKRMKEVIYRFGYPSSY